MRDCFSHKETCTKVKINAIFRLILAETLSTAVLYATVSASFVIEQEGLPHLTCKASEVESGAELWNGDIPKRRLDKLLLDTEAKQG